jgi:hypothetical protein
MCFQWIKEQIAMGANIPSDVIITKDEELTTTLFIMRMRG